MTAAERMQLIRAKLGGSKPMATVPKGVFATAHPECRMAVRKRAGSPPTGKEWRLGFGCGLGWRTKKWVHEGDEIEARELRFRHSPHHLTKIAEKWKMLKKT